MDFRARNIGFWKIAVCLLPLVLNSNTLKAENDVSLEIFASVKNTNDVSKFTLISEEIYFYTYSRDSVLVTAWRMNLNGSGPKKLLDLNIDIPNTGGFVGTTVQFVKVGNQVYSIIGGVIWRYNLATKSTEIIERLPFTPMSGYQPRMISFGGCAYIFDINNSATRLYKVTSTSANASLITTLPYTDSDGFFGGIDSAIVYKNRLYFSYNDGARGPELWVTDGTAAGTDIFFELVAGGIGGLPANFLIRNDVFIFSGSDTGFSANLYQSDGTPQNTNILTTIEGGFPRNPSVSLNNKTLFDIEGSFGSAELWSLKDNGTSLQAERTSQLYPLSNTALRNFASSPAIYQNLAFFGVRYSQGNFYTGFDVWSTSGETGNVSLAFSRPLQQGSDSLSANGLISTDAGIFWSERYSSGGMTQTPLYEDIMVFTQGAVRRLRRFPGSFSTIQVKIDYSITAINEVFIPVLVGTDLDIYSTISKSNITLNGPLTILLED